MRREAWEAPKKPKYLYMIDGVSVPKKIYARRQEFGEYKGAHFEIVKA